MLSGREQQLSQTQIKSSSSVSETAIPWEWEKQKQRLLASLEDESKPQDEKHQRERISIDETIRITDESIARKDEQIVELKKRLNEQIDQQGGQTLDDAATLENLDRDTRIQEQRQRLSEIQEEWEEKLRQAEVEISVERAKIARQLVELEEKRRNVADNHPANCGHTAKEPTHGRWRSHLGL